MSHKECNSSNQRSFKSEMTIAFREPENVSQPLALYLSGYFRVFGLWPYSTHVACGETRAAQTGARFRWVRACEFFWYGARIFF